MRNLDLPHSKPNIVLDNRSSRATMGGWPKTHSGLEIRSQLN
jgi:hypothetical protein